MDKSKYDKPYVIRPEEFDELVGYKAITLKYFVDGTLIYDDNDEPVDDVEDVIGIDALDCFGEDDAVYVRDDERKIDYEVLLDMRTYADYINSSPTSHGG